MIGESAEAVRESADSMRHEMSREKVDRRLDDALSKQPILKHALEFPVVGRAVLIAAVVALVLGLLASPQIAAIALVLVFLGSWLALATRSYERRRKTLAAQEDD